MQQVWLFEQTQHKVLLQQQRKYWWMDLNHVKLSLNLSIDCQAYNINSYLNHAGEQQCPLADSSKAKGTNSNGSNPVFKNTEMKVKYHPDEQK